MELIKPGTNFDFVANFRRALLFSWALIALGVVSLVVRGGPNYGIDFAGGTLVQVRFKQPTQIDEVRKALASLDLGEASIQDFGGNGDRGSEFLVRVPVKGEQLSDFSAQVTSALESRFGKDSWEIQRIETVGPRVGSELRWRAIFAVLAATLMMGVYIWIRFELRFGIGAAVALFHDVLITIGALSLANYEFDLTIVAALLTVVGFSVNDTVIVSDRIRENLRKNRRDPLEKIINRSINETLSRTILTTGTAVLVLLALFFLGGKVINGFAFTLLVGFLIGTYSSIFIASPIVLYLQNTAFARAR
ncbi:MAG: protein-export membrane protein SecF [Candidatus Binatia bacterium]|nr:MAG: protein-export membrane protein SecF [Candidatus Binatia bacterium]